MGGDSDPGAGGPLGTRWRRSHDPSATALEEDVEMDVAGLDAHGHGLQDDVSLPRRSSSQTFHSRVETARGGGRVHGTGPSLPPASGVTCTGSGRWGERGRVRRGGTPGHPNRRNSKYGSLERPRDERVRPLSTTTPVTHRTVTHLAGNQIDKWTTTCTPVQVKPRHCRRPLSTGPEPPADADEERSLGPPLSTRRAWAKGWRPALDVGQKTTMVSPVD